MFFTGLLHSPRAGSRKFPIDQSVGQQPVHNVQQPLVFAELGNLEMESGVALGEVAHVLSAGIKIDQGHRLLYLVQVLLRGPLHALFDRQAVQALQDHGNIVDILGGERDDFRLFPVGDLQQPVPGQLQHGLPNRSPAYTQDRGNLILRDLILKQLEQNRLLQRIVGGVFQCIVLLGVMLKLFPKEGFLCVLFTHSLSPPKKAASPRLPYLNIIYH